MTEPDSGSPSGDIYADLNTYSESFDVRNPIVIDGYTLRCTCGACPEQYDVFDSNDKKVGYLRLRHGTFRVDYPDAGGDTIYTANPVGDGIFADHERERYLKRAVSAIKARKRRDVTSVADALDANPVVIDMLEVAKEAERVGNKPQADVLRDGADEIERLENLVAFYRKKFDAAYTAYMKVTRGK